jgi:hypothetical protein
MSIFYRRMDTIVISGGEGGSQGGGGHKKYIACKD